MQTKLLDRTSDAFMQIGYYWGGFFEALVSEIFAKEKLLKELQAIENQLPMRPTLPLIAFILFSCQTKKESTPGQDTPTQQTIDGDYEFYAGAVDDGYLYYKLSLTQKGNDLTGSLFTGIYLSKNDQGYTMPASMMTSLITGQLGNGNKVMLYLGAPTDTTRMESTYKYPEPEKIFDGDANGDPVKGIEKVGSDLRWIHQGDTLLFTKVPATTPQ